MKTFKKYIIEMAPPANWDMNIFKQSFKKIIEYANKNGKRLASGSSRTVFEIPYENRPTVLKIAKNRKGLSQNMVEGDYGLYRMYPDITVPLIDVDEEYDEPRWIHLEKADKITESQFKSITGLEFKVFGKVLQDDEARRKGGKNSWQYNYLYKIPEDKIKQVKNSELFSDVTDLLGNFDLLAGDLTRINNWGLYKGKPVIIDLGFNEQVQKEYYK